MGLFLEGRFMLGEAVETIPNFFFKSTLAFTLGLFKRVRSWKEEICKRVSDLIWC